jgi:hypothetical protein
MQNSQTMQPYLKEFCQYTKAKMRTPIYNTMIAIICLLITMPACVKNDLQEIKDDHAKVILAGYACGPACDAMGYVIQSSDSLIYNPGSLPVDFRINNLPVKIAYKRTGNFPATYAGPHYEQIAVLQIMK